MAEETGIQSSLAEEDMKEYLEQVVKEDKEDRYGNIRKSNYPESHYLESNLTLGDGLSSSINTVPSVQRPFLSSI